MEKERLPALHSLLFQQPEVTDPGSSQSPHVQTDPVLPRWWKTTPIKPTWVTCWQLCLHHLCQSTTNPPAIVQVFTGKGKNHRHRRQLSLESQLHSETHPHKMQAGPPTSKCKPPSFDLVLASHSLVRNKQVIYSSSWKGRKWICVFLGVLVVLCYYGWVGFMLPKQPEIFQNNLVNQVI